MRRPAIGLLIATVALAPAALAPPVALADAYTQVLYVYQAQGSIPPCSFTSPQLSAALRGIDTYGAQYFADFTDAIQTALAERASGACTPGANHAITKAASAGPVLRPGPLTASTDAGVPAPILAIAALGLLFALLLGLRTLSRAYGWEPVWATRWRHACAEASYRVNGGFASFGDWWRWGR